MNRRSISVLAAGLLVGIGLQTQAQTFVPKSIEFAGAPDYSNAELLQAAGLKPGAPLTQDEMQAHGQKLMDTGLFESLTFQFGGDTLVYTVTPVGSLVPVQLENFPLRPGFDIQTELRARVPLFHGKVPTDGGLLDNVHAALEQILAAQGIKAAVEAAPVAGVGGRLRAMGFTVTAPPVLVGKIALQGASAEMDAKAQQFGRSVSNSGYDQARSAENIEHAFALFYADEGYARVKVHAQQNGDPAVGSQDIQVPFAVNVEEGPHYKLGAILLPSGAPLDIEALNKAARADADADDAIGRKEGVTVRAALQYESRQCVAGGHLECVVQPHVDLDDATGVANYRIEEVPGPVYTMGKLTIENGADDLRAAMTAAWSLPEGAPFTEAAVKDYYRSQGKTRLGKTFASAVCRYRLNPHRDTHSVDVILRIEPRPLAAN